MFGGELLGRVLDLLAHQPIGRAFVCVLPCQFVVVGEVYELSTLTSDFAQELPISTSYDSFCFIETRCLSSVNDLVHTMLPRLGSNLWQTRGCSLE